MSKKHQSEGEWKQELTQEQYCVLREEGTERPFTSSLNDIKAAGDFVCAGCGAALFSSAHKFDSGTGWPSFYEALPSSIETRIDHAHGMARTEYHCAQCGGHQGHLFPDGPEPTGLRYCNNGIAIRFKPKE